jgi:hypothetical protein
MQAYIKDKKPIQRLGKSKGEERRITGNGYLVPKKEPFICKVHVDDDIIDAFPWDEGTDRETGLKWGERALEYCFVRRVLVLPFSSVSPIKHKNTQNSSADFQLQMRISFCFSLLVELKTENYRSEYLYVQTEEGGHQVHVKPDGGIKITQADTQLHCFKGGR